MKRREFIAVLGAIHRGDQDAGVCVSKYWSREARGINPIGGKQWQDLMT